MYIASCRLTLRLPGNDTLKGKRQVSRSLIMRLRQRFNLAVAEVDGIDQHQRLVIGMACVSNQFTHATEVIDKAIAFVDAQHIDAELIDVERDVAAEA